MSKEEKKAKKLQKKEAKQAKKDVKLQKAAEKANAKAEKKHEKAYSKFVKDTEKKNAKLQAKAAKEGKAFVPVAIPPIGEFQTKGEIKAEKSLQKAYAKYVKKLEKKNAKAEKKCAKKGKPFVPVAIPTYEEFAAAGSDNGSNTKRIILMIILLFLIWFLIYFAYMYYTYDYVPSHEETTISEDSGEPAVYDPYSNPHEITTTPSYSVADAKLYLRQTLKDNWNKMGLGSDPSNSISYNGTTQVINGSDCYMFTAGGRTYAVSTKLSACYYCHDGQYDPLTFNDTDILFGD